MRVILTHPGALLLEECCVQELVGLSQGLRKGEKKRGFHDSDGVLTKRSIDGQLVKT